MNNIGEADLKILKEKYKDNIDEAMDRLEKNYPIQYLIGYVDFYGIEIEVNENVLIPRFETELLVSKTCNVLEKGNYRRVLDIGTGSGCIAIFLKKHIDIEVDACDKSLKALEVAKKNAIKNKTQINFFELDILREEIQNKYDVIISNPPYVKTDEYVSLETKYEPQEALYANKGGLEFYIEILKKSVRALNDNGLIIFEIGATLGEEIKKIALEYYPKAKVIIEKDYNNLDRFMFIYT